MSEPVEMSGKPRHWSYSRRGPIPSGVLRADNLPRMLYPGRFRARYGTSPTGLVRLGRTRRLARAPDDRMDCESPGADDPGAGHGLGLFHCPRGKTGGCCLTCRRCHRCALSRSSAPEPRPSLVWTLETQFDQAPRFDEILRLVHYVTTEMGTPRPMSVSSIAVAPWSRTVRRSSGSTEKFDAPGESGPERSRSGGIGQSQDGPQPLCIVGST